jgi:hypothetical protein
MLRRQASNIKSASWVVSTKPLNVSIIDILLRVYNSEEKEERKEKE